MVNLKIKKKFIHAEQLISLRPSADVSICHWKTKRIEQELSLKTKRENWIR